MPRYLLREIECRTRDRHSALHTARHTAWLITLAAATALAGISGCKHGDPGSEAPPPMPQIVRSGSSDTIVVASPERFHLATAVTRSAVAQLNVTGSVSPDVSREVPVLSLANGRVVALHVGLGDTVRKGQLVMEVQSPDVSTAFSSYLKAVSDEHLTQVTLVRDQLLYDKGAIAQNQLQAAQNGEEDAKADLNATSQQLRILGVDKNHPSETVRIYAPSSGVVISQNVTAAGAAGITYAGPAGSLTIADLSHVWVVCDVYENDLSTVHLGEHADIRLTAFPGKTFSGTVSDIGAALDPGLRTAKVRIQVQNPSGTLRLGMFATATLSGAAARDETAVPSTAILQLHDLSYVYVPGSQSGAFHRVVVRTGAALEGGMIEITGGLQAGNKVVANALDLQNTADQQ